METDTTRKAINPETKKKARGILMVILILASAFLFFPTLFLQQSFAATTVFTVNNEIWINATGISPSGDGDPIYQEIKIEISQSADKDGNLHILGEGDRTFTPTERQEWLLFKDMTRVLTSDPTDYFEPASSIASYFGFPFINGSLNCSPIAGSYFESQMPAVSIGSAVREVMILFDAPATYAAAYCAANGYTYLNVINCSYEQIINFDAINTYRSRFLESAMYTLTDDSSLAISASSNSTVSINSWGEILYLVGQIILSPALIATGLLFELMGSPNWVTAPDSPPPLDPPPASEIENMTVIAIETYGHSADQALQAYLNGSIDFVTYQAIIAGLGDAIFGGLNNSIVVLEDLWRDYYNTTESMYNTYADMYESYLEAFSASWTDWFVLVLFLIIIIIVLIIIYKVIRNKVGNSVAAPQVVVVPS